MAGDDEAVAARGPGAGVIDADAARPPDGRVRDGFSRLQPQGSAKERHAVEIAADRDAFLLKELAAPPAAPAKDF